jgi:O-antigen ligase
LPNGFPRVFLQSQVFVIPSFFIALAIFVKKLRDQSWKFTKATYSSAFAASLFLSVILISLSRSFWLGAVLGLILASITAICYFKPKIRILPLLAVYGLIIAVISSLMLYASVRFPFPRPISDISASLITDRATEFEAGAASRWALLPVMKEAIAKHPIEGSGLGKTLTYITSDPRVRQHSPDGSYTTHAFEWGWLDVWLKLGLLGVVAMIWLLISIGLRAWKKIKTKPILAFPVLGALISLAALNMFTPYLNHPLGFGYIAILMVLANPEP